MPPSHFVVLVNPAAGQGRAAALAPELATIFAAQGAVAEVVITRSPAEVRDRAAEAGADRAVVAVGGDGTAHDALNGVCTRDAGQRSPLGVLPAGSADDWARTLKMPQAPTDAVAALCQAVTEPIDVGRSNEEYFLNSISVGFDALVTARAQEIAPRTGLKGLRLYTRTLAESLLREYGPIEIEVAADDGPLRKRRIVMIMAAVGRTYGGGIPIVPSANPHDGLLDLLAIDSMPFAMALARVPFVLAGRHEGLKPVHMERVSCARFESDSPMTGQIDGDVVRSTSFSIDSVAGGIDVLQPPSL